LRGIEISPPAGHWGTEADSELHVVLVEPEIPGNTGNIARLCAGTGAILHLVKPLGFNLEDRYLRRAGLDYWPNMTLCVHECWDDVAKIFPRERMLVLTTKTDRLVADIDFPAGAVLVFGKETRGLDPAIREGLEDRCVKLPMRPGNRSLNLSNTCAVLVYEARRRSGWRGE
jgi:tRNA (cytidine/uridine-2'-O-)-methyltransferase